MKNTNYLSSNRISILLALTTLLLISFNGNAQLKAYSDGKVGIGTTSSPAGKFLVNNDFTGSDSSFVITTAGRVGIGTSTSPGYKLDVNGDMNLAAGSVYRINGVEQTGASKWTAGTGSDIYRSSGNVGIGITSPGVNLHIGADNSTGRLYLAGNASGSAPLTTARPTYDNAQLVIGRASGSDGGGIEFLLSPYSAGYGWKINAPDADSRTDLRIWTRQNSATWSEKFTIQGSTGNVGIGTTSPGALLDLGLAGTKLGVIRLAGSTSGNVTVQPAPTAGTWTLTLPTTDGNDGDFLQTNGSGTTSWCAPASSAWHAIQNPVGNQSLSMGTYTTAWASSATTGGFFTSTGNSIQSGNLFSITSNSTVGAGSGNSTLLNLSRSGSNSNTSHTAYGIQSSVTDTGATSTNVAGYFSASGAWNNYGLIVANGNVGIGTTSPGYRLEVAGESCFDGFSNIAGGANINPYLYVDGDIYCANLYENSDAMFKTNVDSLHDALTIIRQLKPKTYYFDTINFKHFNFGAKKQYGFIAQDLEQILPDLVKPHTKKAQRDTLGNIVHPSVTSKAVNYIELIAVLTKGIQEQQQTIDSLEAGFLTEKTKANEQDSIIASLQNQVLTNNVLLQNQMDQLMTIVTGCCSKNETRSMQSSTNQTNVDLKDGQTIVLEQNVPNPFAEQTAITYYLPDNTVKAQMLFYNAEGKLIQAAELTEKGKGVLNVFASDLSNGIYTYTLVVDGKIIETKKMLKQ